MLSINKNFGNKQQIDAAFTRINGTNITGFGEIGRMNFTIKDDILQRTATVDYLQLATKQGKVVRKLVVLE